MTRRSPSDHHARNAKPPDPEGRDELVRGRATRDGAAVGRPGRRSHRSSGRSRQLRSWIGVETTGLDPGLRAYFNVPNGQGVLVSSTEPGSPAAKAGLAAGDVLLEISGRAVNSGAAFHAIVRELAPEKDATIAYLRDCARRSATLRVASRDVAVWNAEVEGVDRIAAIEALAAHQRREATRVSEMLEALRRGDAEVAATLESREAKRGAAGASREGELAALRRELDVLQERVAELERELARIKTGG